MKNLFPILMLLTLLISCHRSNSGGYYNTPYISSSQFVSALNDVDGYYYDYNELVKYEWDTVRSDEDWFVIWDGAWNTYVAVSLQYIRTITYYDYYASNYSTAEAFREIQGDDWYWNGYIGDGYGNDYEEVYYQYTDIWGERYYRGYDSGLLYEDQEETLDVSLMSKENQELAFFKKASNISVAYKVNMPTALGLVTLGSQLKKIEKEKNGEFTVEDMNAVKSTIEGITQISYEEFEAAQKDEAKKEALIEELAKNIGSSSENVENKIFPELLGIEI